MLRMPSQCTLARFGASAPLRPLTALAVRRVLLSPPISEKVRIYGSFLFSAWLCQVSTVRNLLQADAERFIIIKYSTAHGKIGRCII